MALVRRREFITLLASRRQRGHCRRGRSSRSRRPSVSWGRARQRPRASGSPRSRSGYTDSVGSRAATLRSSIAGPREAATVPPSVSGVTIHWASQIRRPVEGTLRSTRERTCRRTHAGLPGRRRGRSVSSRWSISEQVSGREAPRRGVWTRPHAESQVADDGPRTEWWSVPGASPPWP